MMNDSLSRKILLQEAEHTEMFDKRDKETMLSMIRSCPSPVLEMNKKHYLFIFQDDSYYDTKNSIKKAVREVAKYNGEAPEMFFKCLGEYDEDDKKGIIELYNHFVYNPIIKVYAIEDMFYSK